MHKLNLVPKEEISNRIELFKKYLQEHDIDIAILAQNIDIFYLCGSMQNGYLIVPAEGEPRLYIKKSSERAAFESPIAVEQLASLRTFGEVIKERFGETKKLGLEMDVIPYGLATKLLSMFPSVEAVDISFALRLQRSKKSEYELAQLYKAAGFVDEVIRTLPDMLNKKTSELQLAANIEHSLRINGNINIYRMRGFNQELALGMVASGYAAATPTYFDGPAGGLGLTIASPQGASSKLIERNEPILVDISTVIEGYMIDQTRMAVLGELPVDLQQAYNYAKQILREVEKICKPGISWETPYLLSLQMSEEMGLKDHFMGYGKDQARFLGHGVGLELDELPILARGFKQVLEENMVIAVEPKFTFPGRGVVGIENTYVVTKTGLRSITFATEDVVLI